MVTGPDLRDLRAGLPARHHGRDHRLHRSAQGAARIGRAMWRPAERYPDPAIEILDPRFAKYRIPAPPSSAWPPACAGPRGRCGSATAATCCGATSPTTASCAGTRRPARSACSASPRTSPTATRATARAGCSPASTARAASRAPSTTARITVLADSFEGKRLNSPNDMVVQVRRLDLVHRSALRHPRPLRRRQGRGRSCRPTSTASTARPASSTVVAGDVDRPNGLCFSPDETRLYVVESRRRAAPHPRLRRERRRQPAAATTRVHRRAAGARPTASAATSTATSGAGWGMGSEGRDGVRVFAPDGTPIGRIHLPERCANLCFGGAEAQPAVHGGEPVALRALRQHAGCARRLRPGPIKASRRLAGGAQPVRESRSPHRARAATPTPAPAQEATRRWSGPHCRTRRVRPSHLPAEDAMLMCRCAP